jgi:hypothetical protein
MRPLQWQSQQPIRGQQPARPNAVWYVVQRASPPSAGHGHGHHHHPPPAIAIAIRHRHRHRHRHRAHPPLPLPHVPRKPDTTRRGKPRGHSIQKAISLQYALLNPSWARRRKHWSSFLGKKTKNPSRSVLLKLRSVRCLFDEAALGVSSSTATDTVCQCRDVLH